MPDIKKRKKTLISPAVTGVFRTHQEAHRQRAQRCHPTPKPAGTTDAPCLPSRQEDGLRLPRSVPGKAARAPARSRDGLPLNSALPDGPPRLTRAVIAGHISARRTRRWKGALPEAPCPSSCHNRSFRTQRGDILRRTGAGAYPAPVSVLLLTDGPQ